MGFRLDDIPGLPEAVASAVSRETEQRQRAFLPMHGAVAGLPCMPLTLRHFVFLHAVQSPFLLQPSAALQPSLEDAAQFLWIVSPAHIFPTPWLSLLAVRRARKAWLRRAWPRLRTRTLGAVCEAIHELLDDALFDRDRHAGAGHDDRPIAHFAASVVHEFARAYGWPDEVLDARGLPVPGAGTLDKPLARLFQYRRVRTRAEDPEAFVANPFSDEVELERIRAFVAAEKARLAEDSQ